MLAEGSSRVIARRLLWRLSRRLHYFARGEVANAISRNGEATLQARIVELLASEGRELVAVDVGANLGEWTLSLLDLAGAAKVPVCVHAFEPVPRVHAELEKRIRAHPSATGVVLVPECVGAEVGRARMHVAEGLAGSHSLVHEAASGEEIEVPVTTLEAHAREHGLASIDLLKIDAEGLDFDIIRGALALLREGRVGVLQFEYNSCWIDARHFLRDVFELVEPLGLAVGRLVQGGIEIHPTWHAELERFIEGNWVLGREALLRQLGGRVGHFDAANTYALD